MQEKDHNLLEEDFVFALDIGTRNVIGIVAQQTEQELIIIDSCAVYHPDRNMFDGQIHDIEGVIAIVQEIKETLEKRNDLVLTKVGIAAAGRALKTHQQTVDRMIDDHQEIDKALVNNLEMEAIQIAQSMLDKEESKQNRYYCVGYTVTSYGLNGSAISSLIGHKGEQITVNLIATFLPHIVVDSLYTVMHRVGLEVTSLTLEPIAAIHIAIPQKARLLNLAMVDIGAGTSDIAITKDGSITAYAMTTIAGDKLTEEIAQQYLLDFDQAEMLKVNLQRGGKQTFCDIVGMDQEIETDVILDAIQSILETMANQIADNIMRCNQKAPSAIFLVGGGSQIPRLPELIAQKLSMPKERVVVKGPEVMKNIQNLPDSLKGPDAITPLGIAVVTLKNDEENFLQVMVNGHQVKLFNAKQLFISDALVLLGYQAKKLLPKRGPSLKFFLNGQMSAVPGTYGESGKILLNDQPASLESKIKDQDRIVLTEATAGGLPTVYVKDLLPETKMFWVDNQGYSAIYQVLLNDEKATMQTQIKEDDKITWSEIITAGDLLQHLGYDPKEHCLYVEGEIVLAQYELHNNEQFSLNQAEPITTKTALEKINELPLSLEDNNHKRVSIIVNGKPLTFEHNKTEPPQFFDLFNYVDLDINTAKGTVILKINDQDAAFTDPIKSGDRITIDMQ